MFVMNMERRDIAVGRFFGNEGIYHITKIVGELI
jgi:hypothetical protein